MAIHLIKVDREFNEMTFRIDGVEKDITVGVYPNGTGIAIDYGDDGIGVPFKDAEIFLEALEDKEMDKQIIEEANQNAPKNVKKIVDIC